MLQIDYFSDVLCVWAWIAQVRNDKLQSDYGDQIALTPKFMNLFGNTEQRIAQGWQDRGGYHGFAEHVEHSVASYPDAPVNEDVWRTVQPKSSMPAHLVLAAIRAEFGDEASMQASKIIRHAFFVEALDISRQSVLLELVAPLIDVDLVQQSIASGVAFAELAGDYQQAEKQRLHGSPSWLLNGGRQTLFGNVGYRVLSANCEQLLRHPNGEASWC
ncbi:DsbA family oxidoreductase [Salinibius halmophilus]|uniref:DsbA family oxidoreductase n=1 Tax=Salinibius halmophilus TaxID=1853216 RepID=UPI001314B0D1|nr:DsbA family protein [Salinibius halmophilus]